MPLWRGQPYSPSPCTLGLTEDVKVLLLRFTGEIFTDYECAHMLLSPLRVLLCVFEHPGWRMSAYRDGQWQWMVHKKAPPGGRVRLGKPRRPAPGLLVA